MINEKLKIETTWNELLREDLASERFSMLKEFLRSEMMSQVVFPPESLIFHAFECTPVDKVKAVIIGQDPYHGVGQAHGLCFSVNDAISNPPSLKNIFKELKSDIGMEEPCSGNLSKWTNEGVLLLNATLTVRQSIPGSHQGKGWEEFTDAAIKKLSEARTNLVFLLWGKHAQNKSLLINQKKGHLILKAPHPSPFSAYTGFLGCKHFSKTNVFLREKGIPTIDWNLNTQ